MADPAVRVEGLREFRRDLRQVAPDVNRQLAKAIRSATLRIAVEARVRAPKRTGALARSIRPSVRATTATIVSTLPYAPVVHWGGTIEPKGAPIRFKRTEFITRSLAAREAQLINDIGDGIDAATRAAGWR